ncbi:MAG: hypothetical protein SVR04_10140 [Spirochaetota bacterium]|nr:hypothetical protein [Spirochaetota bacterium]
MEHAGCEFDMRRLLPAQRAGVSDQLLQAFDFRNETLFFGSEEVGQTEPVVDGRNLFAGGEGVARI